MKEPHMVSEDELHLVVPLTPSRNEVDKWTFTHNFRKLSRYKGAALAGVRASLASPGLLAIRDQRPWAERVELSIVRCSDKARFLDEDNVIGGCKALVDALVKTKLVIDDTPKHVVWYRADQRIRNQWGDFLGPATHLFVRRLQKP
jgi:hypothetical protein